jgi:hypothetical protein
VQPAPAAASRWQEQPAPRHLYVATTGSENAVYSFPITNGIPSRTPDAVLYPNLKSVAGIAVDPGGYLYVADGNYLPTGTPIDVFAPGATGKANPIRQILTNDKGFGEVKLFGPYVVTNGDGLPVIYAKPPDTPGTPICAVCITQPIEVLQTGHQLDALAMDPFGVIYASVLDGGLYEYPPMFSAMETPPYSQTPARIITIDTQYYGGLAVDTKDIYARDRGNGKGRYILVNVIPATSTTGKPVRQMEMKPCGPSLAGETAAFAIAGAYLYVECHTPEAVFIYDKLGKGLVSPIFSLTGPFQTPTDIALGP